MDSSYIGVLLCVKVAVTFASPPNVWKLHHLCASLLDRLGPLLSLQKQKRNVTAQLVHCGKTMHVTPQDAGPLIRDRH